MGGAAGACCGEGGATACGVACGAGPASMNYVGCGQGDYAQETTYRYIGNGGDFVQGRPRDFTCIITGCGLLAVLLLIPLLLWLLLPCTTTRHTWTTYNPTTLPTTQIITVQTTLLPTPRTSWPVPTPCPPGPPPGPVDPRRPGVVVIIARVARAGAVAGRRSHPMIATPASGIGSTVGLWRRRHGVAGTRPRAARSQEAVVCRRHPDQKKSLCWRCFALACVPSSGALDLQCTDRRCRVLCAGHGAIFRHT